MLVLTRRPGQLIQIGADIQVTIIEVRGDQVRIGINAPRDVPVHRQEIWDEICAENAALIAGLTPPVPRVEEAE